MLRFEEIAAFVEVAAGEGIGSVRLTGGEPLARLGCADLVRMLRAIPGVREVSLTTNGTLLPRHAQALREAGLQRVNIGLPSLDPGTYRQLTRGGSLAEALAGLDAALAHGFAPVKVNVVLLRGINDDPAPFVELTRRLPVEVRFIEYMPIGPEDPGRYFVAAARCSSGSGRWGRGGDRGAAGTRACPARLPRSRRTGASGLHHAGERALLPEVQPAAPDRRRAAAAVPAVAPGDRPQAGAAAPHRRGGAAGAAAAGHERETPAHGG